ncbi:MAG: DUF4058 family protein [Gemmataceae bacterium]|nr:DUF4058 family protein [Gemmataceae bacterium]
MATAPEAGLMPLYDHFHRPIFPRHQWPSFHSRWTVAIADDLNRRLPPQFLAESPYYRGSAVAADVAETHDPPGDGSRNGTPHDGGGAALAVEVYAPPAATISVPAVFPDECMVEIRDQEAGRRLLAVVELVSPANKKEADERNRFAGKCLSYLYRGIGLVMIDIVTERHANLHNLMVELAGHDPASAVAGDPATYCVAYRPVSRKGETFIDEWHHPLAVGSPLPTVPLYLKGYGCVRLDLEATYAEACERSRIP